MSNTDDADKDTCSWFVSFFWSCMNVSNNGNIMISWNRLSGKGLGGAGWKAVPVFKFLYLCISSRDMNKSCVPKYSHFTPPLLWASKHTRKSSVNYCFSIHFLYHFQIRKLQLTALEKAKIWSQLQNAAWYPSLL